MTELANATAGLDILRHAVNSIGDDQLRYRTPCRDYDVAALAGHVVDSVTRISAAAGVVVTAPTGTSIAHMLDAAHDAVSGWGRRGADGDVPFGGRTLPARDLLGVIGLEFVVHGWDFATAVATPYTVPDDLAEDLLQLAQRTITPQSRRHAGFDDPVPIDAHASAVDRLLAFTGRQCEQSRLLPLP
jgi:uncharacterized protein (TIGR03086 family)